MFCINNIGLRWLRQRYIMASNFIVATCPLDNLKVFYIDHSDMLQRRHTYSLFHICYSSYLNFILEHHYLYQQGVNIDTNIFLFII